MSFCFPPVSGFRSEPASWTSLSLSAAELCRFLHCTSEPPAPPAANPAVSAADRCLPRLFLTSIPKKATLR